MSDILRRLFLPVLLSLAAYAFAQPPAVESRRWHEALKAAGLSEATSYQVTEAVRQDTPLEQRDRARIRVIKARIDEAMTAPRPPLAEVNALIDEKASLEANLEKRHWALLAKVRSLAGDDAFLELRPLLGS